MIEIMPGRFMEDTDLREIIEEAFEARKMAYTPYSHWAVGAALKASNGQIFRGCNIENAAYTPTNCAERTAFFKAVSYGIRKFSYICIVGGWEDATEFDYCGPCGVCRQVMMEFCDPKNFLIILAKSTEEYMVDTLEHMLPMGFGPSNLNVSEDDAYDLKYADKDEYWDIYDKDKKLTGRTMKRNVWTLADDEYHLSVLGVVKRSDGRYLITKRTEDKRWAPGWWEVPGGGVLAGETSEAAVKREVLEETGIDVSDARGQLVLTYHRENPGKGDNYFVDVYLFEKEFTESDVKLQEEETAGFAIATLDEISEYAHAGIFLHYDSIREVFDLG